jgi:branched-chain amino acid aminotransferase
MPSSIIYLNGQLVEATQARVSVLDQGFLHGYGAFETMRAWNGKVFRLDEHLARLTHAAEEIGILLGGQMDILAQAVRATLEANDLPDARVRVTVTAGEGPGYPELPAPGPPTIVVLASALPPETDEELARGYTAIVATRQRDSQSILARLKSTSYLENLLARWEAKQKGADEAIILNERGCLAECAMANIFVVEGRRLATPSPDCGLLRGITRQAVIEIATDRDFPVDETWFLAENLKHVSEVFITNSIHGVMPVTSIDGRQVGDGQPGAITRLIHQGYQELVAHELGLGTR